MGMYDGLIVPSFHSVLFWLWQIDHWVCFGFDGLVNSITRIFDLLVEV